MLSWLTSGLSALPSWVAVPAKGRVVLEQGVCEWGHEIYFTLYAGQGRAAKMWSEAQSKAAKIYGNICWTRQKVAQAELLCLTEKASLSRPQSPTLIIIHQELFPLPESWQSTNACRCTAAQLRPQGPFATCLVVFSSSLSLESPAQGLFGDVVVWLPQRLIPPSSLLCPSEKQG